MTYINLEIWHHKILYILWWCIYKCWRIIAWFLLSLDNQPCLTHWGRDHMAAIFQTTFSNAFPWMKNVWISIKSSLKFVPRGLINNIQASIQIMVWRRPGHKPLSEPVMVRLLTHIYVTRPQRVKYITCSFNGLFVKRWYFETYYSNFIDIGWK